MKFIFALSLLVASFALGTTSVNSTYSGISSGAGVDCTQGTNGQFYQTNGSTCSFVSASGTGNVTGINSDTTAAQTIAVGTSGTDFAIVDGGSGDHTLNLPSASGSARGVVTTGAQTIAGAKTFSSAPVVSALSASLPVFTDSSKALTNSGTVPIANGGTNSTTSLTNGLLMVSSGGAIVEGSTTTTVLAHSLIRALPGFIESPSNKTYTILGYAPTSGTINKVWFETVSGTLTAALKINGTNVTGLSAVSVSSTGASTNATAANTFSAGDKWTLVVSSISSPVDFDFAINWTVN